MVDLVRNEHLPVEILQTLNQYNSVTLSDWNIVTTYISNDSSDFICLKPKINSFISEHPNILIQIKNHFYDEIIEHILKRSFRVQFTNKDSQQTNLLYTKFFIEQEQNIRIIFDYFCDDIKLLLSTGKFQQIPSILQNIVINTPKYILRSATIIWLQSKGPQTFTNMLYTNLINPPPQNTIQQQSNTPNSFSFDQINLQLFLILFIFILLAINIPTIGTIMNFSAGILLIIFILYYSLTYSNKK